MVFSQQYTVESIFEGLAEEGRVIDVTIRPADLSPESLLTTRGARLALRAHSSQEERYAAMKALQLGSSVTIAITVGP